MLKSSLKKVVASLAVLFSGLMLFSQEPITGKGSFTVQCGKYEILLNMDNKFTMNKLIYEGYEVVPVGANTMVLAREPGKYIGGPHTEGGEEKIGKVEFYVDDKKLEPENKGKYDVKTFVMKKTSLLDKLRLESTFILNQDGIIEQRQFEALDEQNVALLYAFCYCFNYLTKEWMASLADGKTVAGVFADNKAFLVREDAKYLAEYDPASQKGMIVFFPEVIPGKGHKSTFWDVGGVYHKYYLMMDVPSVIKKGFKSKLMTIMLKGFSAVAQDWKPTVEKNVEKMLIDGKKYLAETDSKTVGSNLSKKDGNGDAKIPFVPVPPQIDVSKEDWLVNRRGIEALDDDFVLPPFVSVKANDKGECEVWGRKYTFDNYGFISQAEILGEHFFEKPMSFKISINGKEVVFSPERSTLIRNPKGKAEYLSMAKSKDADIETRTSIEYDGMVRIDFTLIPKGSIEVNSFKYNVHYPSKNALFMHYVGARGRDTGSLNLPKNSYSRSLPEGDGTVWKSPFKTLVWMGNYEKGFLWFCESEKNWSPLERNQRPNALTISRMGNEVILEVSPVTQSTIISSPTTYTFGFFATPVRPETKGWRSWTHNYADKAMDAEKRFGVVTKVIFASVYLTGGGEKNVAFYPRIWDRSRYAETAKNLHAEGKIIGLYLDPMWMSMGILKNPVHSIPPDWNPATDCIENENSGQNNTFRWRPPEIKFFDEWKVEPSSFAPYYKERGESQFMASLKSRYADFLCYLVEEQAKMGADGITDIDEWVPMPDMNSRHDTGFSGRDGKKYPEYDWFGRRELLKRFCAIFLKERGKPPIMFAHTAATLTIPCTSLCDGILTGENSNAGYLSDEQYYDEYFKGKNEVLNCIKNGGENWYYYAVPIDRWAVECGKQFGFAVMVMSNLAKNKFNPSISQSENATRDFLATAIIHDNLIWPIFCNPDPAYKLLKIRQDFKIDDDNVIFYPYWGSKKPAMTSSENVYISTYRNNDKFLINISNLGLDDKDLEISLNPDFFKNGEIAKVINAESKEELTVEKNVVKTNLNKRNYKIFIAE